MRTTTNPSLEERFIGCLVGTAVGDALGAPLEHEVLPAGLTVEHILEDFILIPGFPYGQYTDDTQLTMTVAESIVSERGVDGADIAQRFMRLFIRREILGAGLACSQAMLNMTYRNVPWSEAGAPEGRAGNGAAMRVGPVGLWDHDHPEKLQADVNTASIITHKDKRSIGGALAIATGVAYLAKHSKLDSVELLSAIGEAVSPVEPSLARDIEKIEAWLDESEEDAIREILQKAQFGRHKGTWCGGITPYVVPTVLLALHNFLRYPDDYGCAVTKSILVGGDTDTTAAITGALSGTYNGIPGIPKHLAEGVLNSEYIHRHGKDLFQAKMGL
jgi:ADP-ribosylglycohydrolase